VAFGRFPLRWINAGGAKAAHTKCMIFFAKQPFAAAPVPAPTPEHHSDSDRARADVPAWTSSIDLMTVPAAWPVAVSTLAQKFMACQVREMQGRRG
jgi:hypothetical protein